MYRLWGVVEVVFKSPPFFVATTIRFVLYFEKNYPPCATMVVAFTYLTLNPLLKAAGIKDMGFSFGYVTYFRLC